ncbi:MAG: MOSC domain-containing protein [Oscillospiraceae bacterium]|jgi:MOSC domain-containing protein YiiM|nr:MOSC domain-containing protein [Oscillospiraceae bacterium]
MMKIEGLFFKTKSGDNSPQSLTLIKDFGISGDKYAGKNDRQVCLLDLSAAQSAETTDGLCTKRFTGNLLTSGLDYKTVKTGDKYLIGGCEIEIVQTGKKCYPQECPLLLAGTSCSLPGKCAFAKVISGGTINVYDEIVKKGESL